AVTAWRPSAADPSRKWRRTNRRRRCSVVNMPGEASAPATGRDVVSTRRGREAGRGMEAFIDGAAAGYGIAIPVGAVAILVVGAAMHGGFSYGFSAGAGAATADLLYALVAAVAGSVVAARLEPWSRPIRVVSAAVLAAIAVWGLANIRRNATQPSATPEVTRSDLASAYFRFVGITIVNPLTVV